MELNEKLITLKKRLNTEKVRIMILGLGSVGNYLLTYLLSTADENMEIIVAGRNKEKIESDVNIARIAALIRGQNKTQVTAQGGIDLDAIDSISDCLKAWQPDIVVNTSRVYSGLKYGSISWKTVRAYGIWTPLSIKYIKNIMEAHEHAQSHAIVINTSYSDGTIPWLKSAGKAYPDFGSGNLNHLIPRIKYAVAQLQHITDFWNIDIDLATAHFHDVVISKEGQNEGVSQLLHISYNGKELKLDQNKIFSLCKIPMPVDEKRNMMNASSNFAIIAGILQALRNKRVEKLFVPGAFGEIGGYPVIIDGTKQEPRASIDETHFSLDHMRKKNQASIALDGIENIVNGTLVYTDALIEKTKRSFGVTLPKKVPFAEIDTVARFIIERIIQPSLNH